MNGDFESYVVENIRCDDWDIEWDCDIEQNCQWDVEYCGWNIDRDIVSIAWHWFIFVPSRDDNCR